MLTAFNVIAPLAFLFKRFRRSIAALFVVGICVNIGMWLERWVIIVGSLSHDFMPHNWRTYAPTWVEISITVGSFAFFLFWFFGFSRFFPTIAASDVKELAAGLLYSPEAETSNHKIINSKSQVSNKQILAVFSSHEKLLTAMRKIIEAGFDRIEVYSPFRIDEASTILHPQLSPVRIWTLVGAIAGCIGGFWLSIGTAYVNGLVVGAKFTPATYIPYCIVGFEGLILIGTLANLAGMLFYSRLGKFKLPEGYDLRFTQDRFGLLIESADEQTQKVKEILSSADAEKVNVL